MGVSGGLVPCPEALGVMLIAISLGRISLGLALIVAFSFGLAAVLIAIGILLVRFRGKLDRLGKPGSSWQRLLPLVSAVVVTVLGVGIVLKGLMSYVS
jgi:nickel/cobalt exporter